MDSEKIREVVFDVDGTLLDTEYAVLHSMQDGIAGFYGKKLPLEDLRFGLGIPGVDVLHRLGFTERIPEALRYCMEQMLPYADTVSVFPGLEDVIKRLSEAGYGLGIVTSRTRWEFEEDFGRFSIAPYFGTSVTSDESRGHKPGPEPLLTYLEKRGLRPEELLYLGDTDYDRLCAENAGTAFALAGWGANPALRAELRLREPRELLPLLGIGSE